MADQPNAGGTPEPATLAVPSLVYDLGEEQRLALLLTGTVPIPSPFPAAARLLLTTLRRPVPDGETIYYVKIVETIRDRRIVTRFVRHDALRAVRLRPRSRRGRYRPLDAWRLVTGQELREKLDAAMNALQAAEDAREGGRLLAFEIPIFIDAAPPPAAPSGGAGGGESCGPAPLVERLGIAYVPETASVLVRVEEVTVAAEVAESGPMMRMLKGPIFCCSSDPPLNDNEM